MIDEEKIQALRKRIFEMIKKELEIDDHHKSYEGALDVSICYPNYFESDKKPIYQLGLHCYVLGPSRYYKWHGDTLEEAIQQAHEEIDSWAAEIQAAEEEEYNGN